MITFLVKKCQKIGIFSGDIHSFHYFLKQKENMYANNINTDICLAFDIKCIFEILLNHFLTSQYYYYRSM